MKKYLHIIIVAILIVNTLAAPIKLLAQEAPPAVPSVPTVPTAPTAPEIPQAPTNPIAPSPMVTETPTPKPTRTPRPESTPTPTQSESQTSTNPSPTPINTQELNAVSATPTPSTTTDGDNRIITGDANTEGTITTEANTNGAIAGGGSAGVDEVNIDGNGSDSSNTATIEDNNNKTTIQENSAAVNSDLTLSSDSGSNESSGNMGDTLIKTGDANVSGTIITAVNTNVDGVVVSEFNVADDHRGDIVLDFGSNCTNCSNGTSQAITNNNGAGSNNTTNLVDSNVEGTFQTNEASIGNTLTLDANSGNNAANANTGGDSVIYTGDANVNANMVTMANNNIAGNIVYGVVNIYGDLVGDIIFPEEQLSACCATQTASTATSNNGTNSSNNTNTTNTNTELTFQTNEADINNTLNLSGETGSNNVSANTGGDNRVITGDAQVVANVVNVANTNLDGGNMWLVIVNEAGKWIGKIIGGNSGTNMAASEGTTLTTNEFGEITATNGNGANSNNNTNIENTNSDTTVQTNKANINNVMNLSANTGGNSASDNTGGDSNIVTGDATIIANMVNFVNNNITGGGKLFVTVVNVFGSWIGDFITPGQHKSEIVTAIQNQETAPTQQSTQQVSQNNEADQSGNNNVVSSNDTNITIPTVVKRFQTAILGQSKTANQESLDEFSSEDTNESFEAPEATITPIVAGKKVVSINLAWLIFLVPGGILLLVIKNLFKKVKRTSR